MNLKQLKKLRKDKGISLTKMSEITGISKGTCFQIENETGNPSFDAVNKYINALEMELRILIKEK